MLNKLQILSELFIFKYCFNILNISKQLKNDNLEFLCFLVGEKILLFKIGRVHV